MVRSVPRIPRLARESQGQSRLMEEGAASACLGSWGEGGRETGSINRGKVYRALPIRLLWVGRHCLRALNAPGFGWRFSRRQPERKAVPATLSAPVLLLPALCWAAHQPAFSQLTALLRHVARRPLVSSVMCPCQNGSCSVRIWFAKALSCCCRAENPGVSVPKFQLLHPVLLILTGLQRMGPNSGPGPEWPDKEQAVLRGLLGSSSATGSWPPPLVHLGENPQGTGSQVGRGRGGLRREHLRGNAVMTDSLSPLGVTCWEQWQCFT